MGWKYQYKSPDLTIREFFEAEWGKDAILDMVVGLRTAYAAVNTPYGVRGLVIHLDYKPNNYCNFGYAAVEEAAGPHDCECPERILNLLAAEPPNEDAREWRQDCWEHIARTNPPTLWIPF